MIKLGGDLPRHRPSSSRPPPAELPLELTDLPPPLPIIGMVDDPSAPDSAELAEELADVESADAQDLEPKKPPARPPVRPPPRVRAGSIADTDLAAIKATPAAPEPAVQAGLDVSVDVTTDEAGELTPAVPVVLPPVPIPPGAAADLPVDVTTDETGSETPALPGVELRPPLAATSVDTSGDGSEPEERVSIETELLSPDAAVPPLPPPRKRAPSLVDDGTRDAGKKPPPPPKRTKAPSLPGEVEAPRVEAASQPRAKRWWEELFTEDFARGLYQLTPSQLRREVTFIEESLGVAKGGIVLDLGCGTGQHAVELSSRGYGVVGFDLALPQLMQAGEYAQERNQKINFLQGDMREMSFDSVFDGVYSWDTSFGYFEEDKNIAVVERVFRALRPGGNFLLDVVNRDFVTAQQPSQNWFEGDACVCMDDMSVDFITSRLRVKRTMMMDDGRTRESSYSIRVYSLHELGRILHSVGFRVLEASGHLAYPGTFFGATSPRIMILAQKP